jgi:PAS domain-containing protein
MPDVAEDVGTLRAQLTKVQAEIKELQLQVRSAETLRAVLCDTDVKRVLKRYSARVYVEDREGHIVALNGAAMEEFELEAPQSIPEKGLTVRECSAEAYGTAARNAEQNVMQNEEPQYDCPEVYARRAEQPTRPIITSRIPLRDPAGRVSRLK